MAVANSPTTYRSCGGEYTSPKADGYTKCLASVDGFS